MRMSNHGFQRAFLGLTFFFSLAAWSVTDPSTIMGRVDSSPPSSFNPELAAQNNDGILLGLFGGMTFQDEQVKYRRNILHDPHVASHKLIDQSGFFGALVGYQKTAGRFLWGI